MSMPTDHEIRLGFAAAQMERDLLVQMLQRLVPLVPMDERRKTLAAAFEAARTIKPMIGGWSAQDADIIAHAFVMAVAKLHVLLLPAPSAVHGACDGDSAKAHDDI